jgi:hypothetical protein
VTVLQLALWACVVLCFHHVVKERRIIWFLPNQTYVCAATERRGPVSGICIWCAEGPRFIPRFMARLSWLTCTVMSTIIIIIITTRQMPELLASTHIIYSLLSTNHTVTQSRISVTGCSCTWQSKATRTESPRCKCKCVPGFYTSVLMTTNTSVSDIFRLAQNLSQFYIKLPQIFIFFSSLCEFFSRWFKLPVTLFLRNEFWNIMLGLRWVGHVMERIETFVVLKGIILSVRCNRIWCEDISLQGCGALWSGWDLPAFRSNLCLYYPFWCYSRCRTAG